MEELTKLLQEQIIKNFALLGQYETQLDNQVIREEMKQLINDKIDHILFLYSLYKMTNHSLSKAFDDLVDELHRYKK